jgi:hypothetical protein
MVLFVWAIEKDGRNVRALQLSWNREKVPSPSINPTNQPLQKTLDKSRQV